MDFMFSESLNHKTNAGESVWRSWFWLAWLLRFHVLCARVHWKPIQSNDLLGCGQISPCSPICTGCCDFLVRTCSLWWRCFCARWPRFPCSLDHIALPPGLCLWFRWRVGVFMFSLVCFGAATFQHKFSITLFSKSRFCFVAPWISCSVLKCKKTIAFLTSIQCSLSWFWIGK